MNRKLKSQLSKINFRLGRNPRIERRKDFRKFIPEPYKTVVLISADFELAWAPRYDKSVGNPLQHALELAQKERKNIPKIIELTNRFNLPITWATVGHLFLRSCHHTEGRKHPEIPPVSHYEGSFWDYSSTDWFEYDPCTDVTQNPEWYAPDLIKEILDAPARHEIGCHTFSHIDCRDEVCSPELMRSELIACKKLALKMGLSLQSFVHPGHTIGNLDVLKEEGFTSFRSDYRNALAYPKRHPNGLWELQQSAQFYFREGWSSKYHVFRYLEILKRAIRSNTVCVFWFHPSFDAKVIYEIWPEIFEFIDQNRSDIWITTHAKYINFLNQNLN